MPTGSAQINGSSSLEMVQSNQDLIISKGRKKKRTWIIASIVAIIITALIIATVVLLTKNNNDKKDNLPIALALEDILNGRVNPNYFNASWVSGDELLFLDENKDLVLEKLSNTGLTKIILVNSSNPLLRPPSDFELSADRQYLKIGHAYQKRYRYSFKAKYTIINLKTREEFQIKFEDQTDFLLAVWTPSGNGLVVVLNNNIYHKPTIESVEFIQITKDNSDFIINGVPDWVYEEEVFSSNKAVWMPQDGRKLAYANFNDSHVPIMVLPIYGDSSNPIFLYPRAQIIKYPKVGTPNPKVSLFSYNFGSGEKIQLELPKEIAWDEPILATVAWATNDTIVAIWMNRVQNSAVIIGYETAKSPHKTIIIKNIQRKLEWLELFTPPLFSEKGSQLAMILSQPQSGNRGSFRHLTLLNLEENSKSIALTSGAFVVTEILAWKNNDIFYLANTEQDFGIQHLYSVNVETKISKCLSCSIKSFDNKTNCLYNTAEFSKDGSYYAITCSGPDVPHISLYSLQEKMADWETNKNLRDLVKHKQIPSTKRFTFEVADGFTAQVMLKLPPNMDTSGKTKYPMLVNVYAGPDSFQVVEKFNLDWGSYLAANKSIIYALIDGRGSGLKGDKILFSIYRKLGTVEITDQINVTRQIQESLNYVDSSRTAIWGWSYGGYASGMVLANDKNGLFKCGISVAPVTDWRLYDSIYTERFMGIPVSGDNELGYESANLLRRASDLKDKEYFLIHGTYDDNVHYQQSMLWAKVLEQNDVLFRQLSYPDEDHGLSSVRPHLYHSLENFLDDCFISEKNE